jgi:hypothetical protein
MRTLIAGLLAGILFFAAGTPAAADEIGDKTLAALEQRLLAAGAVRGTMEIRNEGVNPAELKGEFDLRPGNRSYLRATGKFRDAPLSVEMKSDQAQLGGVANGVAFTARTPSQLTDSLIVKLVRMGMLHTIAVLSEKHAPDLAEGEARNVLQTRDAHRDGPDRMVDGRIARPIAFTLVFGGKVMGDAILWIDLASGLPLRREQTVRFGDQGEMHLVERYDKFELGR